MRLSVISRFSWLAWLLIALPIGLFAGIALHFAENIPWFDDVEMFVGFIQEYYNTDSSNEKAFWLLEPNSEHRILFAKLAALGTYLTTDHLNFRGMILTGNLFALGLVGLLYVVFRSMRLSVWAFVPVPFMLLHPQYYMTISWSITSLQHPVVLFLSCLVMYLLARGGQNRFLLALPLQIFSSLSMSNALFAWLSGGVILWRQGHYRRLAVWLLTGALTIVFYFQYSPARSQGSGQSLDFLFHQPHLVLVGFLSFVGGSFDWLPNLPLPWRGVLPTLGGILLLLVFLRLLLRMDWPFGRRTIRTAIGTATQSVRAMNHNFFLGCYGLLLINAAAVAVLRMINGYGVMLVSNYMIYPALLVALLYVNGLQDVQAGRRPLWQRLGMGLALLIWDTSYGWHLPEMAARNQYVRAAAYNQQRNAVGLGGTLGTPFAGYMQDTLSRAVRDGYYVFPPSPIAGYVPSLASVSTVVQPHGEWFSLEAAGLTGGVRTAFAVLQSDRNTYLLPTQTPYRPAAFWLRRPLTVLQTSVFQTMLHPGTYRVGWATESDAGRQIRFSDKMLVIE